MRYFCALKDKILNINNDMDKIKKLLGQISKIVVEEKIQQEERRKRGENFNIFKELGLSSSEVRLHSAFLADSCLGKWDVFRHFETFQINLSCWQRTIEEIIRIDSSLTVVPNVQVGVGVMDVNRRYE